MLSITADPVDESLNSVSKLVGELANSEPDIAINFEPRLDDARILVIDDEPINIKVIQKYLRELGYQYCRGISDPTFALEGIELEKPDLIVLDIVMPQINGCDLLKMIRADRRFAHLPVIVLTASCDRETRLQVMNLGATDFLSKPIDPSELAPRIRTVLSMKRYQDGLQEYARTLEARVRKRTEELESSRRDVIHCLARAAEYRDDDTGHHVIRVGKYAGLIGRALGMSETDVETLEQAAQLHDIGKIGIPDEILLKPGKLDPDQYERMQKHVCYGKRIIEPLDAADWESLKHHPHIGQQILEVARSPLLKIAARIALTHHEKWDGSGYPLGLSGEDIPLESRITAVADVFDALSSKRPYKQPFPVEKCFDILNEERNRHFDPMIVDAFLQQRPEIARIQILFADVT